jgi:hypothetical protein
MRPSPSRPPARRRRIRRFAATTVLLALIAAGCGGPGDTDATLRDTTGLSGPDVAGLQTEGNDSTTSEGETTATAETTTTLPPEPCPVPQTLPRGVGFDQGLVRLHRATTAFAESARALRAALESAGDFSPGWGAREPVASAFYRMQADLYTLALLLERTYAADGATYSPDGGWAFPEAYPLASLADPWATIPEFQAVTLTGLFAAESAVDAAAFFEGGGICGLVAAFTAAIDQAAAESGA